MLFMVVEHFRNQDARAVYRRFREKGRQCPEGLSYVGSWITADLSRCFQLMEADDVTCLQQWAAIWSDLVEFEIVPVAPSKDVTAMFNADAASRLSITATIGSSATTRNSA
jgi:hypothetical protein